MKPLSYWIIPLALIWPALQLLLFAVRFGGLTPEIIGESVVFLVMGLVAGAVLLFFIGRANGRRQRIGSVVGYLVAGPIALVGSLLGGLLLPPVPAVLIFGALPLIVGTAIGYALTRPAIGLGRT